MLNVSDTLYLSAATQLLLTTCLVVLLWSLYTRLQRFEFFEWWAWAWTAFAIFLATASLSLHLGPDWTLKKTALVLIVVLAGYVQPVLLVFGGLSWQGTRKISRKLFWEGIAATAAMALLCFALSFVFREAAAVSFAVRNVPRTLMHAAALVFCCFVFWREFRRSGSHAAAITGIFCLAYSLDQLWYFLSFTEMLCSHWNIRFPGVMHALANPKWLGESGLLFVDIVDTCGICLGMILLLIERYQHTATELILSEQQRRGLAVDNALLQSEIEHRHRVERELRHSEEFGRQVIQSCPVAMVVSRGALETMEAVNERFFSLFGYSKEEIASVSDWWLLAYPDAIYRKAVQDQWMEMIDQANTGGKDKLAMEARVRCKDGSFRDIEFHLAIVNDLYLVSFVDLTDRKKAMEDLKERAMYMDALISNVPLGIVIKDENQRVRFCNPAFEHMFQYTQAEIQGKDLDELIAPHDWQDASQLSYMVRNGGTVHTIARRRRKDSTFIDVELHGVKVVSGKSFVGAFAIYQDISDRRKAEEKLIALRSRLARAQEEERARIARDLHDDAGQRLALLSIDLEQLRQVSMELKSSLTEQLEALAKAASEITSDVHNVSRRLHPSQVDLLGLGAALSNFCKDFAARNGMEIEFTDEGLNQKPTQDAALCLFRVAQEAIRNVQKHSGTRQALVQLDDISGATRLRVSDKGEGFDPSRDDFTQGLGLLSMQERLHSLGGELFIQSKTGSGTCIEASIPLSAMVTSIGPSAND